MASISSIQSDQVTFLSGITPAGTIAAESYWTWNRDAPASYGPDNYVAKWGASTAGTPGQISYAFDLTSNWTTAEKTAFVATMKLWSAVANISFTEQADDVAAVIISRATDDTASGGVDYYRPSSIGSATLGSAVSGGIEIDTSAGAFGPLGSSFSNFGGYPWMTLIHELGHVLGLGHGGPYDDGLDIGEGARTAFDSRAWTIMSYNDAGSSGDGITYGWGTSASQDGLFYPNVPTTWMPLDIIAIQRLYGVPANTPLSGGQVFGFNSNIHGEIARFFDFSINSRPIITLWSKGSGNTLDLSGFASGSNVSLVAGTFSSVAGLTNNVAIAYGTRIDAVITGPGADNVRANDNGNFVMGGAGADSIAGGSGNDHLYGAAAAAVTGDGADTIAGGDGSDYLQGNGGEDSLNGGDGSDRVVGGQGNDSLAGGGGNDSMNGNLGNDSVDGGDGNDSLRGGQGNDGIIGGAGEDLLLGDLGSDSLSGGAGIDMFTGGGDADIFTFAAGDARFATSGATAGLVDMIADFTDGVDHIHIDSGIPPLVLYGAVFDTFAAAATRAQQLLTAQPGFGDVAALQVGTDTYVFYDPGASSPIEAFRLHGIADPATITATDFI